MRKIGSSELNRKSDKARHAIRQSYYAERDGMDYAARAIARRMVDEVRQLRYMTTHPSLSYGITIEQSAEISKQSAIRASTMYRAGLSLAPSLSEWARFVADEIRWQEEDSIRNAA